MAGCWHWASVRVCSIRDADLPTARRRAGQLGPTRIAAGVAILIRPQLLAGALGLNKGGVAEGWLPRLLAVREVALGSEPERPRGQTRTRGHGL